MDENMLQKVTAIDLERGVLPISKAAASLAELIRWCRTTHQPVVITQNGAPAAVLLDVEGFEALRTVVGQLATD